jgi:hypothetical protein
VPTLRLARDDAPDELLSRDPLALLLGMLFDQHMRQRGSGAWGEGHLSNSARQVIGRPVDQHVSNRSRSTSCLLTRRGSCSNSRRHDRLPYLTAADT